MSAIHHLSLAEIATNIRAKEISPVEVVDHHLQRTTATHPQLNAFVHIDQDGARAAAQAAEAALQRGDAVGPLHGAPITVKSCIDVTGWPCAAGSLLRKEYVPSTAAGLVKLLPTSGTTLLANTTTPQFLTP